MSTVVVPSSTTTNYSGDTVPLVKAVNAGDLCVGQIVTNLGIIDAVSRVGVFVVAAIRGTLWSLASGKGDIATLDVVWHQSETVTVDRL